MMSMRTGAPYSRRIDVQLAGRQVDLGHDGRHERNHDLGSRSLPGSCDDQQILAVVQDVSDSSDVLAAYGQHGKPDELMITKLVRIGGVLELPGIHEQQDAAKLIGVVPVITTLELHQQPARVPPRPRDGERPGRRGLRRQHGTRGKPQFRIVRPHVDGEFAANAVRSRDAPDHQLHDS
jgi:hypothetical protein